MRTSELYRRSAKKKVCIVNPGATDQLMGEAKTFGGAEQRSIFLSEIIVEQDLSDLTFVTSRPVAHSSIRTIAILPQPSSTFIVRLWNKISQSIPFLAPKEHISLPAEAWNNDIFIVFGVSNMAYRVMRDCQKRGKVFILAVTSDDCLECTLGLPLLWEKNFFQCPRWRGYKLITQSDQVWIQTESQKNNLRHGFARSGVLLPNPLPFQASKVIVPFEQREGILWVGKSSAVKNPMAALKIARDLPHLRFTFVLNAADTQLREQCLQLKADNVQILDFCSRDEIRFLMSSVKLLINTSIYEGLPNSFLEAWAFGTPVLSLQAAGHLFIGSTPPGRCFDGSMAVMLKHIEQTSRNPSLWIPFSQNAVRFIETAFPEEVLIRTLKQTLQG